MRQPKVYFYGYIYDIIFILSTAFSLLFMYERSKSNHKKYRRKVRKSD